MDITPKYMPKTSTFPEALTPIRSTTPCLSISDSFTATNAIDNTLPITLPLQNNSSNSSLPLSIVRKTIVNVFIK